MQQTAATFGRGAVMAVMAGPKRDAFPEPATGRTCVVVLGMHRSGTSVLAGTLGRLGITLPTDLLGPFPGNPKGHFESETLYQIHERMLAALHTSWYDIRPIGSANLNSDTARQFEAELTEALKGIYDHASLFVLKDPRICRFFPLCRSVIETFGASPRVVLCVRNPLEVASSLRARDRLSLSHGLGLWLRHVLDAEHHSRGGPRVFIDYSKFLQDWRTAIDQIEQRLGITLPGRWTDAENAVDEFVDVRLRHETSSIDELRARFGSQGWVGPCYEAITHLVRNPDDREAMERLDLIRTELEEPVRFFGGGIKEYYTEIQDLRRAHATQTDQLEEARAHWAAAQQHELEALVAELNFELEGLRSEHTHTLASLQEIEAQRSHDHAATLGVLEAEREAWHVDRAALESASQTLTTRLEEAAKALSRRDEVLEAEREAWRAERTAFTTRLKKTAQALSQRDEALDQAAAAVRRSAAGSRQTSILGTATSAIWKAT